MDEEGLLSDLKVVREKGVARTTWNDVPALRAASGETDLENFLRTASEHLDPVDAAGVQIALGIGGFGPGRSSADRRSDFATHYQRTAETVRRKGNIEDQVFRRLARVILRSGVHQPPGIPHANASIADADAPERLLQLRDRVRVGYAPEVGTNYQRRGFDDEIDQIWSGGGDRRVWLRGQPGLGKSYTARRILQDANESLVIWVESADVAAVRAAFSKAVDQLPYPELAAERDDPERVSSQAENLLRALETCEWDWLIVFDNADAIALLDARLIPTGRNPRGRLLVTMVGSDNRVPLHGRTVKASRFTEEEAQEYLRGQVDARDGGRAAVADESSSVLKDLALLLGHHPLGLSIASATIAANGLTVAEWKDEFQRSERIDDAADEADAGGYPHAIGVTFRLAMEKASTGLPDGVAQRAATVCAVQDPDGHPTWLWDRKAVRGWVAGGVDLASRHGRPVVVERLIAHGLVELDGDTWTGGRLAMHQLASRAVRESSSLDDITAIGVILTLQWLANLIGGDAHLGPNIAALLETTTLEDTPVRIIAAGLAAYAKVLDRSTDDDSSIWAGQLAGELASYGAVEAVLSHLGPRSKGVLADQAMFISEASRRLGDADQARRHADRAAKLYEEVLADPTTTEVDCADALTRLGWLYERAGQESEATNRRQAAADSYERLLGAAASPAERLEWTSRLASLAERLGDLDRAQRARIRFEWSEDLLLHRPKDKSDAFEHGARLCALADMQRRLDRVGEARHALERAAEIYRQFGRIDEARDADLATLSMLADAGDWAEAELLVARLVEQPDRARDREFADDLMRLASVRTNTSNASHAIEAVATAVDVYRAATVAVSAADAAGDAAAEDFSGRGIIQLRLLGGIESQEGRWSEARQIFARELDLLHAVAAGNAGERDYELELAAAYSRLGMTATQLGHHRETIKHLSNAILIRETILSLESATATRTDMLSELDLALSLTAFAHGDLGETSLAVTTTRRRVEVRREIFEANPADVGNGAALADVFDLLGMFLLNDNDRSGAIAQFDLSVDLRRAIVDIERSDASRLALAKTLGFLGTQLADAGRTIEADAVWTEQLDVLNAREDRGALADALLSQGWRLNETDPERAIALIQRGVRELQAIVSDAGVDINSTERLAGAQMVLASIHRRMGDQEAEGAELSAALYMSTRVSSADPGNLARQLFTAAAHEAIADWLFRADRFAEAVEHFTAAAATMELLLDLQFEFEALPRGTRDALRGLQEALRSAGKQTAADDIETRLDALKRKHPELEEWEED